MKKTLVCTRKYNKGEYKFYLNEPDYVGEKGILGMEIKPYVSVETPENSFGYSDIILMHKTMPDKVYCYSIHRYLPRWILKKIEKKINDIMEAYYGN